ncbi:MAG: FKBP-type peptidyl-prolyl cis-trans isomerase [Gammaproteobacteria bacterium AqS3]|nr:FKBP-type peptidyl-prolyl cis-trans isomerase [Gammaproteobacteria bacterium AqS3]
MKYSLTGASPLIRIIFSIPALALLLAGCVPPAESNSNEVGQEELERTGYVIGHQFGQESRQTIQDLSINPAGFQKGFIDAINDRPSQLGEEETKKLMAAYEEAQAERAAEMMARKAEEDSIKLASNTLRGDAFRTEYAKRDGVKTTSTGLMYRIIKPGSKLRPKPSNTVEVHYRGTLVDGTEFDSSHSRNQTATFPLGGVIAGWTEGLQLIGEGGTIELVIPPDLGYGDRSVGEIIGPGDTLIFEVELIAIEPSRA